MDEERFARLEQRLQGVEDELAITRLIASYGPLVDAGDAEAVGEIWAEDGEYDVEGWHMSSRADVRAMVRSEQHQSLIGSGACHFLGPAAVRLDGDRAIAVCESLLVLHRDGRFTVWRAGANHFELGRVDGGWQVLRRTTRALNGSQEARDLLARGR